MLYAIISEDVADSLALRQTVRAAHLARLSELAEQQRLLVAGPHPKDDGESSAGFSGSLVIAEFSSLKEAQDWADADPYLAAGVYQTVTVKPFKQVLP